ncbi:MAG TPA: HEAT repeat domain-containing protein, partial [Phycisphaerales bacterium]|nr:HEAT repeat domain-containing protein [Phycisphaerales bacterium]
NAGVRTVGAMAVGKAEIRSMTGAVSPLLNDESPFVRAAAIYALRACGESVDPTPLGAMVTRDPSPRVRAHAAYVIGELGDKGSTALLRDAANQSVARASAVEMKVLQVQIAEALVKLDDEEQLHTLRAALFPSTPEELDATVLAVQVLGAQKDRPSEGQLRNLVATRDPFGNPMPLEVRLAAAGALGSMGVADYEPVAAEALGATGEPQRIQAAWALGEIATPTAVRRLEGQLSDPSERVRVAVAASLLRAVEPSRSR